MTLPLPQALHAQLLTRPATLLVVRQPVAPPRPAPGQPGTATDYVQSTPEVFQQYIPDSQLTAAQFVVLCTVRDHSGSSLADIVKATVIDQATIRGVVDVRIELRQSVR